MLQFRLWLFSVSRCVSHSTRVLLQPFCLSKSVLLYWFSIAETALDLVLYFCLALCWHLRCLVGFVLETTFVLQRDHSTALMARIWLILILNPRLRNSLRDFLLLWLVLAALRQRINLGDWIVVWTVWRVERILCFFSCVYSSGLESFHPRQVPLFRTVAEMSQLGCCYLGTLLFGVIDSLLPGAYDSRC